MVDGAARGRTPRSPAQLWLVGLGAILNAMNELDPAAFGGSHRGERRAQKILAYKLDVDSAEELRALLEHQLGEGMRATFEERGLGARDAWLAWDLGRAVTWAGYGYAAYLLEADEAWGFALRAGRLARDAFGSWDEYATSYAAGRKLWRRHLGGEEKTQEGDASEEAVVARLLAHPESPWARAPWYTAWDTSTPPPAWEPAVLRVGPRGDFATLALALARAAPGDRIVVEAGVYREALVPTVDVEILADASEGPVRVESDDDHALFVRRCSVRAIGLEFLSRGPRAAVCARSRATLRLEGCALRSEASKDAALHVLDHETDAHLFDSRFHAPAAFGLALFDRARARAERCAFEGAGRSGACAERGSALELVGCRVVDSGEAGVLAIEGSRAIVSHTRVLRSARCGVQISDGSTLHAEDCAIAGASSAVLLRTRERATLRRCELSDARHAGIDVQGEGLVVLDDLAFRGGQAAVIVAKGSVFAHQLRVSDVRFDAVTVREGGFARVVELVAEAPDRAGACAHDAGSRLFLVGGEVRGGAYGVYVQPGAFADVSATRFVGQRAGVRVASGRAVVERAHVVGATEACLAAEGDAELLVTDSVLEGSTDRALHASGASVVELHTSTLGPHATGIFASDDATVHAHALTAAGASLVASGAVTLTDAPPSDRDPYPFTLTLRASGGYTLVLADPAALEALAPGILDRAYDEATDEYPLDDLLHHLVRATPTADPASLTVEYLPAFSVSSSSRADLLAVARAVRDTLSDPDRLRDAFEEIEAPESDDRH